MKIAPGVDLLDLTANLMGSQSSFHPTLVWDDAAVVLVDTGLPGMLTQLRQAIDQTGAAYDRLDHIIITHHDIDHIGSLASLTHERAGKVKVLAYTEEIPFINGAQRPLKLAQMEDHLDTLPADRKVLYERMKSGFQSSFAPVDQGLSDGEELPFHGGITVIHTPGHTLGHMCLYLKEEKILIAGDALQVMDGKLLPTPPSNNYDLDRYWQSLVKLTRFDVDTVICYHGGAFYDHPTEQIAALANKGSGLTK
jgi:glyoxylase-like metal-dependent hydrolase (beta-lactamase superfamily II)